MKLLLHTLLLSQYATSSAIHLWICSIIFVRSLFHTPNPFTPYCFAPNSSWAYSISFVRKPLSHIEVTRHTGILSNWRYPAFNARVHKPPSFPRLCSFFPPLSKVVSIPGTQDLPLHLRGFKVSKVSMASKVSIKLPSVLLGHSHCL